jgi:hypothetical protein
MFLPACGRGSGRCATVVPVGGWHFRLSLYIHPGAADSSDEGVLRTWGSVLNLMSHPQRVHRLLHAQEHRGLQRTQRPTTRDG